MVDMDRLGQMHSASDLVDFLRCEHLNTLEQLVAAGEAIRPSPTDEELLVAAKGREHEARYVELLRAQGKQIVELERRTGTGAIESAAATYAAMQSGAEVIHNATLLNEGWLGVADFLRRVERPSALGAWSYEVADAKYARTAVPAHVVQLCVYSDLLARLQGAEPERMFGIMGDGREEAFRYADYAAYYRALKERFIAASASHAPTYPDVVDYCSRCRWSERCIAQRAADDHLSGVANMRRTQIARFRDVGITRIAELADAPDSAKPPKIGRETFERLRAQAALQVAARDGEQRYELLETGPERGFAQLPAPNEGDLFFDMEGDPFVDGGLEYLFGVAYLDDGQPTFRAFWGHDRAAERGAFEAFVDFVVERRRSYPDLHVYHYAPYEVSALKRLMCSYATREDDVDTLLRENVFVDLFAVVRGALRVSHSSYSLKKVETFYRGGREASVKDAIGSVIWYERWRESGAPELLSEIEAYNRDDCFSTLELRDWLLRLRPVDLPWRMPPEAIEAMKPEDEELIALREQLRSAAQPPAAYLVDYHRREAKPDWWAYFARCESTPQELVDVPEAIGDLALDADVLPFAEKRSTIHTFRFPPQEHKLRVGDKVHDPAVKFRLAGTIVSIDGVAGIVQLKRGQTRATDAMPRALHAEGPVRDPVQREALRRFGQALLDSDGERYRAARDVLERSLPRRRDVPDGDRLEAEDPNELAALALALDESYLFVQGPPGSGKTYAGARVVVRLLQAGKRVGVAAPSHKAIHNLLREIEHVAAAESFQFSGLKKATKENEESYFESRFIRSSESNTDFPPGPDVQLLAGTAWLFARKEMDAVLDYVVIDEAGQVALADAIAIGTSARNIILLGDPLQLAQVSKGIHPENAGASVLEHLLGDDATVRPERGVFLPLSFRMHPEICRFISELAYDGRLRSAASCARQLVEGAAGLRWLPVPHEGNAQQAEPEAHAIADAIERLIGAPMIDKEGVHRRTTAHDFAVVTPYNMQARCIAGVFAERGLHDIPVGTVDKFQGQEAPIVFFSMATSSGDDLPRDLDFLFSRNRLNVAISRARALAILVASPALLQIRCSSVEQLRMVNALARFLELADRFDLSPAAERAQISFDFAV
ncbi:MAG TPA: TM0106 family RecB-like putative nuclease [Candidatus Binatia bacterium]|nr:TM0106 family RecB-like putative nuclease [Candidatus Binatia bacterium]